MGQNDENADLKWSKWLDIQSSRDNSRYNISSCICSRFVVVVKEGDEICHLWRNKSSEFLTLCQCLHVTEEQYGRGDSFCKENNLFLESENPTMKIFKLFSIIEGQGG